jgi:alpha-D-xyloside xylohydrolase
VPWNFDEESCEVDKHFCEVKNKLMPYIFAESAKARDTGVPVLRPMVMDYQDDTVCSFLDLQYMFGDSLIVAPVFNERGETETYLPPAEGKYTHLLTGEKVDGGGFVKGKYDYFGLPVYVKPNSILVMGGSGEKPDYDYTSGVSVKLFEVTDASCEVYGLDGTRKGTVYAKLADGKVETRVEGDLKVEFL